MTSTHSRHLLKRHIIRLTSVVAFAPLLASADTPFDRQQQVLKIIGDFADRYCKDIPLEGTEGSTQLSGKANAQLNGVFAKLANLGIEGAGNYENAEYTGVLQKDLLNAYKLGEDCRMTVWKDLKGMLAMVPDSPTSISQNPPTPMTPPAQAAPGNKAIEYYLCRGSLNNDNGVGQESNMTRLFRQQPALDRTYESEAEWKEGLLAALRSRRSAILLPDNTTVQPQSESQGDKREGYEKVRTADGTEGWVKQFHLCAKNAP